MDIFLFILLLVLGIIFIRWPIKVLKVIAFPAIIGLTKDWIASISNINSKKRIQLLVDDEDEYALRYDSDLTKMKLNGVFLILFCLFIGLTMLVRW